MSKLTVDVNFYAKPPEKGKRRPIADAGGVGEHAAVKAVAEKHGFHANSEHPNSHYNQARHEYVHAHSDGSWAHIGRRPTSQHPTVSVTTKLASGIGAKRLHRHLSQRTGRDAKYGQVPTIMENTKRGPAILGERFTSQGSPAAVAAKTKQLQDSARPRTGPQIAAGMRQRMKTAHRGDHVCGCSAKDAAGLLRTLARGYDVRVTRK